MDEIARKLFRFEGFTLDVMGRSLRGADGDVELRPKSFDVLLCLLENAGQLVSKNELIEAVWPDVIVTDESLTRCVSDVRLALGDRDQRLIKTIPRRGYLFAAPVSQTERLDSALPTAAAPAAHAVAQSAYGDTVSRLARWARGKSRPLSVLAGAALLLMAVGTTAWFWHGPSGLPLPDRPSIAVLPFTNMSSDPQQDYFSDGIAEDLTTGLSRFAELFVINRDSAFKYKGKHVDVRQIGRDLGVRYLLQGSTRPDPERVRITAQLIEAATGSQLWAERYDGELSGLFAAQDELTRKIVVSLVAHIKKSELDRALRKPPENLAAYDYFLRGDALMREMSPKNHGEIIAAARPLYERAVAVDPRYAPAMQGLAVTYFRSWMHPSAEHPIGREYQQQATLDRAEWLARRAVELDNTLAKAHATLGWILHWQNRPQEGIAEFERAFEFNPNFVDGRFGALLSHNGRAPEAIDYLKRMMRLDPFYSPLCTFYLGMAHFFVGRYEEAKELFRSASAQMPDHRPTQIMVAAASAQLGRDEDMRAAAAEVLRGQPQFSTAKWLRFMRITEQDYADRVAHGLRKAGLPD